MWDPVVVQTLEGQSISELMSPSLHVAGLWGGDVCLTHRLCST